jgi:hypothetical protein
VFFVVRPSPTMTTCILGLSSLSGLAQLVLRPWLSFRSEDACTLPGARTYVRFQASDFIGFPD